MAIINDAINFLAPWPTCEYSTREYDPKISLEQNQMLVNDTIVEWVIYPNPTVTIEQILKQIDAITIQNALQNKKIEVETWKKTQNDAAISFQINGATYNFQKDLNSKMSYYLAQNTGMTWVTLDNVSVFLTSKNLTDLINAITQFDSYTATRASRMLTFFDSFLVDMTDVKSTVNNIASIDITAIS